MRKFFLAITFWFAGAATQAFITSYLITEDKVSSEQQLVAGIIFLGMIALTLSSTIFNRDKDETQSSGRQG